MKRQSQREAAQKRLLKRAVISWFDLTEARNSLAWLLKSGQLDKPAAHRSQDFIAHSTCLVVGYARPFGHNYGKSHTRPTLPKRVLSDFTEKETALHGRILELRRQEFAHSDGEVADTQITIRDGIAHPVSRVMRRGLTGEEALLLQGMFTKLLGAIGTYLHEIPQELSEGDSF